jgi:hypothetical protein
MESGQFALRFKIRGKSMKTGTKVVVFVLVLGNAIAANQAIAQANKTDCARLQRLMDQYAHVLFLNSLKKDGQSLEVREKELQGELQQLNLPAEMITETQSLLKAIKQCYGFAGSAAYGMKGFFTDLRFRMDKDDKLREKCANIEDKYKKLLQECGTDAVK